VENKSNIRSRCNQGSLLCWRKVRDSFLGKRRKEEIIAKAVKCPVCEGSGSVFIPPPPGSSSIVGNYFICHGCGGKGWVEVKD